MAAGLDLMLRSDATGLRDARVTAAASIASTLAIPFIIALLPFASVMCIAGFVASCMALAALPWPRDRYLSPDDVADPMLRHTYVAILGAREQLEDVLARAKGFKSSAPELRQRCNEAIALCARIAPVANRLHAYIAENEPWETAREAALLRSRATATKDDETARNLRLAAEAYERQLAAYDELARTRDRIQARLDLVLASLRSFAAAVVKQQTLEDEDFALAGESVSEQVDGVQRELAVLESAAALAA